MSDAPAPSAPASHPIAAPMKPDGTPLVPKGGAAKALMNVHRRNERKFFDSADYHLMKGKGIPTRPAAETVPTGPGKPSEQLPPKTSPTSHKSVVTRHPIMTESAPQSIEGDDGEAEEDSTSAGTPQ